MGSDDGDLVEILLEHGANPNAKNDFGSTPLHIVAEESIQIIKILLQHGADYTITNDRDEECLQDFSPSKRNMLIRKYYVPLEIKDPGFE
jgi:tankyrase